MLAGHPQSSRPNSLAVVTSYSNCHTYALLHAWVPIMSNRVTFKKLRLICRGV